MQGMQAYCPVCERYCGPAQLCPYCDATIPLPSLYRKLRLGAWFVAIFGVSLLIIGARLRPPQTIPIAEISPTMQFAQLYFEGKLTQAPRISRNQRSASANLDDGSGVTLRIVFLDEAAQTIQQLSPPLAAGSPIRVSGGLRIRADEEPVLFIRSNDQFHLLDNAP